ncbi:hypothetical protein EYF80_046075 [Liparis tanakae]|uniref:Uncharacterized protein n=1 Tax=Liparis tanakae TaxID=230148 RepID=A0A4Z2FS80_9TELE|nr:hypothetical protein EYF80_046075 [Liparis tanakae]
MTARKLAHSKQVFLLPTQNTEGIPTTSIITYLMRNSTMAGRRRDLHAHPVQSHDADEQQRDAHLETEGRVWLE